MKDAFGVDRWVISKSVDQGLRLIQGMGKTTAGRNAPGALMRRMRLPVSEKPGFASAQAKIKGAQKKAAENKVVGGVRRKLQAKNNARAADLNQRLGDPFWRYNSRFVSSDEAKRHMARNGTWVNPRLDR